MIPFAQGLGFAIPTDTVNRVVEQILRNGKVVRPWLGISGVDVDPAIARRYSLRWTRACSSPRSAATALPTRPG